MQRQDLSARARSMVGALWSRRRSSMHGQHHEPSSLHARPAPRRVVAPAGDEGRAIGWRGAELVSPPSSDVGVIARFRTMHASDWARVRDAKAQIDGHAQPRRASLGEYDGAALLAAQVKLATDHGVTAFAFTPDETLDAFLADASLEIGFCLAGSFDDARLAAARRDPRCLKRDGEPLVLQLEPSLAASADTTGQQLLLNPRFAGTVRDWRASAPASQAWQHVNVAYDDEPDQPGAGTIFTYASPRAFRDRLRVALGQARAAEQPFVVVDSWNDWPRGAVLEPDARLGHAWLLAMREALSTPARDTTPVAVVHAYYPALLDEIVSRLRAAGLTGRLIVTTPPEREAEVRARLAALQVSAEVEVHENRGRDILPFLRVANRLLDEGVDVVVKVHTKSSDHRNDGDAWRKELLSRLLEPSRVARILESFERDPTLGTVAPEGNVVPFSLYWGWNEENVRALCVRLGVRFPDVERDTFVAGSMFWARLEALRPLLDAHLAEWAFEPEGGFVDGTMAHAVERAFALAVRGCGYTVRTFAELCGREVDSSRSYTYAPVSQPTQRSSSRMSSVYAQSVEHVGLSLSMKMMVERVPRGARVLDVGCASGYLAEPLRRQREATLVDGIELDPNDAEVARRSCRDVVVGSAEEAATFAQCKGPYDAALFGDVLEHLVTPARALQNVRAQLAPHGVVIASIPNIAHYTMRAQLFKGSFDYADYGLLDRTHLRFFTRKTILELFADNGYEVRSCDPALYLPERMIRTFGEPMANRLASYRDQLFALQYIVVAVPGAAIRS